MATPFTTEAFTLLGVGVFVIGLRTAARIQSVGVKHFKPDDYIMLFAAVVYALETATAYIVGAWWQGQANNGMSEEQRQNLNPKSQEYQFRVGGSKTQMVGWSLYTLLLWTLKLCMCIFYSRLTSNVGNMAIRVRIGYVLIVATYIATELSILLGCRPFHKNWQINPDPGNYCQPAISRIDLYVTVVLNVATDAYLMSIPIPMFWTTNLPKTKKYLLIILFSGGIFVMAAAILRCALIIQDPINGAQAAGSWACRETFVAVVINNLPLIYPMYRRMVSMFSSSTFNSWYKFGKDSSNASYELKPPSDRFPKKRKIRSFNALPTTLADENGSQEHIAPSRVSDGQKEEETSGITVTKEATISSESTVPAETRQRYKTDFTKEGGRGYNADASGGVRS